MSTECTTKLRKMKLANGLTVLGEVNNWAKSVSVGFFVKAGSRDEDEEINGVSHFSEHLLFAGNEKLTCSEVTDAFDGLGAIHNAFTTEGETIYYSSIIPENVANLVHLWAELMRPAFRRDDIEKERRIIRDEIAAYMDGPGVDVMEGCKRLHFGDHPCCRSVLGSEERVEALTSDQIVDYYQKRYVPNNMGRINMRSATRPNDPEPAGRLLNSVRLGTLSPDPWDLPLCPRDRIRGQGDVI
jgi:predicted Zn-dependent peptidase